MASIALRMSILINSVPLGAVIYVYLTFASHLYIPRQQDGDTDRWKYMYNYYAVQKNHMLPLYAAWQYQRCT